MFTRRKWVLLAAVTALAAAALAMPYLIPLSRLIPDLERAIAQRIHQPVSIGGLRLFLLPTPRLQVTAISVGRNNLLDIDSVTVYPSMSSLFGDTKVIREVEVRGVRAKFELLGAARNLLSADVAQRKRGTADEPSRVRVGRVTLRDVTLRFPSLVLSGLSASIRLQDGKPVEIRASQQRDRLQITARRQADDLWNLDVLARDWKLPMGVPLQFDRLQGSALVSAFGLESRKLSGSLYGGSFSGPLAVSWKSGWAVAGQTQIDGIDLEPVVALVTRDVAMSGKLTAATRFTTQARNAADLLAALHLESEFAIEQGVLHKVDLVAVAKNPLDKRAGKGGKTQFDELKGHLRLDQGAYEFSGLNISSGLFRAQGEVTVNEDRALSGLVHAELRGTASLVSVPLDVSGTMQDPSVFLTRGAMVGAVAGTAILPGIGTAVGMKAGELTERLFGRRKPDNRHKEPAQK